MADGGKRGGGDRILESRHLVGLFLGVVLLCAVFFTLGYVMGRTQYTGAVQASDGPAKASSVASVKGKDAETAAQPSGEWDFYSKKDDNRLEPASKSAEPDAAAANKAQDGSAEPANAVASAVKAAGRYRAPSMPRNSVVLQLAALRRQSDALALADAVLQKRFPAFVIAPASDGLYRVQVGPYRDERSAQAALQALDRAGFKAIIKR